MSKPRTICVFCGSDQNITKQHVLPNRLRRILPRIGSEHTVSVYKFERTPDQTNVRYIPRLKQGHLGTRKIRVVCDGCNSGWIKRAEEKVFPALQELVTGETPQLTAEQSDDLALLACTIFTMIDLTDRESSAISQAERSHIYNERSPPRDWHLYIGRANSLAWHMRYRHHAAVSLPQGAFPSGEKSNVQVSTATIGKLLLHVVSCQDRPVIANSPGYANILGLAELGSGKPIDVAGLPELDAKRIDNVAERLVREVFIS